MLFISCQASTDFYLIKICTSQYMSSIEKWLSPCIVKSCWLYFSIFTSRQMLYTEFLMKYCIHFTHKTCRLEILKKNERKKYSFWDWNISYLKTVNPHHPKISVPSLIEISQSVLVKNIFKFRHYVFAISFFTLPWKRAWPLNPLHPRMLSVRLFWYCLVGPGEDF